MALIKKVCRVIKADSLEKREVAATDLDIGPSNDVTARNNVGSNEFATTTRKGAEISKSGTNAGNSLSISSTTFT